ncbi:lysM and putative peptidoglycan-binding domain-containing protein 4 [Aulostomus maculatus]
MRRGEHVPQAFQAPVDVHASADGQVYMFKKRTNESPVSSDNEELSVMEIRPRVVQDQDYPRSVHLLEREVLDGDSLNKLALQYGCKVADIKRINSLMQEQDLFALKSVKIPLQKHSFLTETYSDLSDPEEKLPHSSSTAVTSPDRARAQPHLHEVTDFLMEVDDDIEKLIQATNDREEDFLDEKPQRFSFRGRRLKNQSSDWGIQWWNAVIAMLLIGIVLPLFYVIYFKTKSSGGASPADGSSGLEPPINSSSGSGTDFGTRGSEPG